MVCRSAARRMKVTLVAEGPIDQALIPKLMSRIAEKVRIRWPIDFSEDFRLALIRKTGHGGVLEKVRMVVKQIGDSDSSRPDVLVIVLDYKKTAAVAEEIRKLTRGIGWIVFGIAIEEIEAWWLADQTQTLAWLRMSRSDAQQLGYGPDYAPESDKDPKSTLDRLTANSDAVEFTY